MVLILLIKCVDVQAVGPEGSVIGLAGINSLIRDGIGFNGLFDKISDITLLVTIAAAFIFVCKGGVQSVKRKSLLKVDRDIYLIGAAFVLLIAVYVFFELVIINYRPIIEVGETLEASFPSSHVFIILSVGGIVLHQISTKMAKWVIKPVCQIGAVGVMLVGFVSRILSGVHWFTDIIGALLISGAVIFAYLGLYNYFITTKTTD